MFNVKARLVFNGKLGEDARVDEILNNPTGPLAVLYKKMEALSKNKLKKGYVESALMCSQNFKEIADIMELSEEFISAYAEFFFDVAEADRLTKIDHIDGLKDKNEALLKMWAISHGLDFIKWRLGYRISISPVEGLHDLFSTCIYKSKEAMFNSSSTEASKESTKWAKLSTDIGRLLKLWVLDSSAAKKDLEIAIREVLPDFGGLDELLEEDKLVQTLADTMFAEGVDPTIIQDMVSLADLQNENKEE
jgi:hypothetical protein